jgi:hypothetical protein
MRSSQPAQSLSAIRVGSDGPRGARLNFAGGGGGGGALIARVASELFIGR